MLRDDSDEAFLQLEHVINLAFHIARRALRAAGNLMDHDIRIWQRKAFAFRTRAQQDRAHARRHAETVRCHIAREELHRVVNGQPGCHDAAGTIDVNVDVFLGILHLQKQQLCNNQICDVIVDRRPDKNDPILEQPRINIVTAFAPAGLFHDHRNQHLRNISLGCAHGFSSLTVDSSAGSTLAFAFRKSRVLPSRICSARSSNASFCCNSLRILSGEMS